MRAFNILPVPVIQAASLSKDALKRLILIDWYFSNGKNAELACRHFCISKSVFYRWLNRFDKRNLKSLEFNTKTRKPHKIREMTTNPIVLKRIYDIRIRDLEKSKWEIHEELKREGILVAHNVIQKTINKHPELLNTQHKKRTNRHRNYKIARIKAINIDNGSEYLLNSHKEIISWGIPHFFTDPHCPKQNGRVERLDQTAEYEYFNYQDDLLDDLDMINFKCMEFNTKYNTKRFHKSLGYKTPQECVNILLKKKGAQTVLYLWVLHRDLTNKNTYSNIKAIWRL